MPSVTSKDGTRIAYDREGQGPMVILVDGALCYRASGPAKPLAAMLTREFTVITYDRRGRGASRDTAPYAIEREVEDIGALLEQEGGSAFVYGISSGAALALEAANRMVGIRKLVLYEAPFVVDSSIAPLPADFLTRLKQFVAANQRAEAVKMFLRRVGVPGFGVFMMQWMPVWKVLKGVAHTLLYDIAIIQDYSNGQALPVGRWANATMPIIVADGGKSPAWIRNAASALAKVVPNASYRTLPGQTHMVKPQAIAPVLIEFFKGSQS